MNRQSVGKACSILGVSALIHAATTADKDLQAQSISLILQCLAGFVLFMGGVVLMSEKLASISGEKNEVTRRMELR